MLFYIKKSIWLELLVLLLLGGLGYLGIQYFSLPINVSFSLNTLLWGLLGFIGLTLWTFGVQLGYRLIKGKEFAVQITKNLAKEFDDPSIFQTLFSGITAAFGEEIFFRGFIQGKWGIGAATLLFGLAHFGKKDIRIVSYWSFAQGFWLCVLYHFSNNLLVPMIAHGLFDIGGVIYFRFFMHKNSENP